MRIGNVAQTLIGAGHSDSPRSALSSWVGSARTGVLGGCGDRRRDRARRAGLGGPVIAGTVGADRLDDTARACALHADVSVNVRRVAVGWPVSAGFVGLSIEYPGVTAYSIARWPCATKLTQARTPPTEGRCLRDTRRGLPGFDYGNGCTSYRRLRQPLGCSSPYLIDHSGSRRVRLAGPRAGQEGTKRDDNQDAKLAGAHATRTRSRSGL